MGESALQVGVHNDTIIVTDPATRYYAIYTKPLDRAELLAHGPQHLTLNSDDSSRIKRITF